MSGPLIKLSFYVPKTHLEVVKQAVFATGAGQIGLYDSCSWETLGMGQFRPMPGATPFLGEEGAVEKVEEYLVEMVCEEKLLSAAIAALKQAHPYEEPAFGAWRLLDLDEF